MKYRRRFTFQLTPLLDLLLIVIFAQYMEVQQTAESSEARIHREQVRLEEKHQRRQQELDSEYAVNQQALEATRQRYSEHFKNIIDQHHQAGTTLADTLNLPDRLMQETIKLRTVGQTADADRLQQGIDSLQALLESRSSELLSFVIRYDEMQKHVSVWELHLEDNGQGLFTDGTLQQHVTFESSEEFATGCFTVSKAFQEPRPLTLILMTWGDTQAGFRKHAIDGLPSLVQQLREDTDGTRWFDYSLIGFRPDGPLMYSRTNVN